MEHNLHKMLTDVHADDIARSLLQRIFPVLRIGIKRAKEFFSADSKSQWCTMEQDEIAYWDQAFDLTNVVLRDTKAGKLFVPDFSFKSKMIQGEMPCASDYTSTALAPLGGKKVRINLFPGGHGPIPEGYIVPFNPEEMTLAIKPSFHLGGDMGAGPATELYNAFLSLDFRVADKYNRPVLRYISGTGLQPWMGPPVYAPYYPIDASCWFNTQINLKKGNYVAAEKQSWNSLRPGLYIHAELNSCFLDSLQIPDDDAARLFFWQVNRFAGQFRLTDALKALPEPEKACVETD